MRIIAGEKRSRKIEAPQGQDTRPTADRVKEALFSMLQRRVYDARVLDLYAGSGALSLEALSRGAASAVLVDMSFKAGKIIRQNIETLDYGDRARFLNMEDMRAIGQLENEGQQFDLIFLDPPYKMDTTDVILRMYRDGMMHEDTILVVEFDRNMPRLPDCFECFRQRDFGEIHVHFYRLSKEG